MSSDLPERLLNPAQRRVAAFALTLFAFLGAAALLIGAVAGLGWLAGFFSGVIWPLALAGVLALILRPVVVLLETRLRLRRLASVVLLYGGFVLVVAGALFLAVPPLINQLIDFLGYLPTLWERAQQFFITRYPQWQALLQQHISEPASRQFVETIATEGKALLAHALPSLRAAGGGLFGLFAFVTHLAIVPVYLFFFLLVRGEPTEKLPTHLTFLSTGVREDVVFLVREFVAIVESFFRGQILIGLIMGVLLGIGFTLVGLKFGFALGVALGVLNIVPYLGTILGLAVALPLAFFQPDGGWALLGLVLLVKGIVQCVEGWFLTPKIMGDRTGLHPVTIIVAIFFWGTAFGGVLGMLLAIPLTAFVVTAWRLAKQKYFDAPAAR
jgi:predicted PurR-regulated permease PerM